MFVYFNEAGDILATRKDGIEMTFDEPHQVMEVPTFDYSLFLRVENGVLVEFVPEVPAV